MDMENIFNQNVDFLIQAKEEVAQCNQLEQQKKQLKEQEDKVRKAIAQEEKSINDEINTTIKKRKAEIESTYDSQLDVSRKKVKQAQGKKDKKKSERVGQRVDEETADVKENSRQLKIELKTLFKKNHVPAFCRSDLYYILFMPKGFREILFLLVFILIGLAGLPFGVYTLFSEVILAGKEVAKAPWLMAVVIAVVIVLVLGLYFVVFNLTKVKHRDTILEGRKIRNQIAANEKNVRAIKNAINKDKDESQYELGAYDEKIQQFQSEVDSIADEKQEALKEFEKKTKAAITEEINGRRLGKLKEMKAERDALENQRNQVDEQIKEVSLGITNKYAKYLGKNICKEEVLNDIIHIMETEQIDTISEGIAIYKGEVPHKGQAVEGE